MEAIGYGFHVVDKRYNMQCAETQKIRRRNKWRRIFVLQGAAAIGFRHCRSASGTADAESKNPAQIVRAGFVT